MKYFDAKSIHGCVCDYLSWIYFIHTYLFMCHSKSVIFPHELSILHFVVIWVTLKSLKNLWAINVTCRRFSCFHDVILISVLNIQRSRVDFIEIFVSKWPLWLNKWFLERFNYVLRLFLCFQKHCLPELGMPPPMFKTHSNRDKMAVIYLTTFSNQFSWMKMYKFWLRFHWSFFPRVQLTIYEHRLR